MTTAPPSSGTHQVLAVFETWERARAAQDQLRENGIPASEMDIVDRDRMTGNSDVDSVDGVWGSIRHFFLPGEDAYAYHEGVNRGHAVLSVRPRPEERDRVIAVLESFRPIDFDAQLEAWREEGWTPAERETLGPAGTRADLPPGTRVRSYVHP